MKLPVPGDVFGKLPWQLLFFAGKNFKFIIFYHCMAACCCSTCNVQVPYGTVRYLPTVLIDLTNS
jgi:hypothetical protein